MIILLAARFLYMICDDQDKGVQTGPELANLDGI